jgi:hypothetical protein
VDRCRVFSFDGLLGAALLVPALIVGGCATVDPAPFAEFASSVQTVRNSSIPQTASAADAGRDKLLAAISAGELSPADLQLTFEGPFDARYASAEDEPLFIKEERLAHALTALNDALAAYAQSLVILAGGTAQGDILPSAQGFEQMTKDLNHNARVAAATLQFDLNPGADALLSVAAVRLFQTYIGNRRREALADAIGAVQPNIEAYAEAADRAVRILAEGIETDYLSEFLPLATASPPDARPILALNAQTQTRLATLKALSESYRKLPLAHADLVRAASARPGLLPGLTALNQEAERLATLVRELTQANAGAAGPTEITE